MTPETERWLAPLLVALLISREGGGTFARLIESLMIAAAVEAMLNEAPVSAGTVNWIRLGQLVREDLGWDDYPSSPNHDAWSTLQSAGTRQA